jgi:hypothetical protein
MRKVQHLVFAPEGTKPTSQNWTAFAVRATFSFPHMVTKQHTKIKMSTPGCKHSNMHQQGKTLFAELLWWFASWFSADKTPFPKKKTHP